MRPSFLPRNFHHHVWIKRRFVSRARLLPHARFSKMDSYPATSRPSARTPSSTLLRAQKYAPPFPFAPLVFSRQTHARGNERGTRDSSGFRLSSITRLDVSLPYQQQFPEIRLTLGIISPREFLSRHRRCVPSRFLSLSLCFSLSLYLCPPHPSRTPNMPCFSFSLIFILVFGSAFDLYRITLLDILCTSVLLPSRCKTPVLFYFILLGESRQTYMYYVYVSVRILELDMIVISRLGRD